MKRNTASLLVLLLLIVGVAFVAMNYPSVFSGLNIGANSSSSNTGGSVAGPGAENGPGTSGAQPQAALTIARPAEATLSHIAYVHDGDTLYLQPDGTSSQDDEIKVRLIGLDTPELRPEVECFGLEARDYLRSMLPKGTEVWIMRDRAEFDKYGRSLLYLWTTDDRSVNLDLVLNGYATALDIAPSNSYSAQFDAAESAARAAGVGLWGSC